mgnify:FL=1
MAKKKRISLKQRFQARKGQKAAKKALKGMGPNVGIGVVGEKKESAAKKRVRKYHAERGQKRAEKVLKKGGFDKSPYGSLLPKSKKAKAKPKKAKTSVFHLKKGTKVRKGAVGVKKTKGGEYVKYGKKSASAGSFRKAFKSGCAGGAKSFSWDGRSYSCKKK